MPESSGSGNSIVSKRQKRRRPVGLWLLAQHAYRLYVEKPERQMSEDGLVWIEGRELTPTRRYHPPKRLLQHVIHLCEAAAKLIEKGEYAAAESLIREGRGILIGSGLNVSPADCDQALETGEYPPRTPR